MKRFAFLIGLVAVLGSVGAPVGARPAFSDPLPLPAGSYPEGIAIGRQHQFYVGSLLDGAVYRGDLRSGEGAVINPGEEGRRVVGLDFVNRSGQLWAAGADDGSSAVFVFDGETGDLVEEIDVGGSFLNDLIVTRDAAYVTDSLDDVLWRIPVDRRARPSGPAEPIPLTGDFEFVTAGELPINLNGIVAPPHGRYVVAVHSSLGLLYRIDPDTGEATEIDLDGASVPFGDGLVLQGRTLYVVQNFLNQITVIDLDPTFASGEVVDVITSESFRIPTTAARFGSDLYVVNARFDVAPPPLQPGAEIESVDYDVVRVDR